MCIRTCYLLCNKPACYHNASKTHVRDRILKLRPFMHQWFIRFSEFGELSEFLFHLGKTPKYFTSNLGGTGETVNCHTRNSNLKLLIWQRTKHNLSLYLVNFWIFNHIWLFVSLHYFLLLSNNSLYFDPFWWFIEIMGLIDTGRIQCEVLTRLPFCFSLIKKFLGQQSKIWDDSSVEKLFK